jgi:hypothetical protein
VEVQTEGRLTLDFMITNLGRKTKYILIWAHNLKVVSDPPSTSSFQVSLSKIPSVFKGLSLILAKTWVGVKLETISTLSCSTYHHLERLCSIYKFHPIF